MAPGHNIALIAGEGDLPVEIFNACKERQVAVMIVRVCEEEPFKLREHPHLAVNLTNLDDIISRLKAAGFLHLVFAGKIQHTLLFENYGGMRLQHGLTPADERTSLGDNSYFAGLVRFVETQGFQVISVLDILSNAIMPVGLVTTVQPSQQCLDDIHLGFDIAKKIGDLDIGQAIVIENQYVLGVEAIEGTDNLIKRCQQFKSPQKEGVLIKIKKRIQDTRIDVPVIGEATVRHVAKARLAGIALEAGASLVINKATTIQLANDEGIFIMGL